MFQIEIPKRDSQCSLGGELMAPGLEYYSALKINEGQESYKRLDYCVPCFERLQKENKRGSYIGSFWKSTVPKKQALSELPKKKDDQALLLLKEALSSSEDLAEEEAFLLSLYLARRRKITYRQELLRFGKIFSLYEVVETEEMLAIPKIDLSLLEIKTLQIKLAKKFNE